MELEQVVDAREVVQSLKKMESPADDVCAVILHDASTEDFSDLKLMGKTMSEWVMNSVFDAQIRCATCEDGDFLRSAKHVANPNCKYTIVLFDNMPLFRHKTFLQIIKFFKSKGLSVLKLENGYVFLTSYLLMIGQNNNFDDCVKNFAEQDFLICDTTAKISTANAVLKDRILKYFLSMGIIVEDASSVSVDADVQIGSGTVLEPNVRLVGKTIVESDAKIGFDSIVENSVVCKGAKIEGARLKNAYVGKNAKVGFGSILTGNAKICDGVEVPTYCIVDGVIVDKDCKLNSFCKYKSEEI